MAAAATVSRADRAGGTAVTVTDVPVMAVPVVPAAGTAMIATMTGRGARVRGADAAMARPVRRRSLPTPNVPMVVSVAPVAPAAGTAAMAVPMVRAARDRTGPAVEVSRPPQATPDVPIGLRR